MILPHYNIRDELEQVSLHYNTFLCNKHYISNVLQQYQCQHQWQHVDTVNTKIAQKRQQLNTKPSLTREHESMEHPLLRFILHKSKDTREIVNVCKSRDKFLYLIIYHLK